VNKIHEFSIYYHHHNNDNIDIISNNYNDNNDINYKQIKRQFAEGCGGSANNGIGGKGGKLQIAVEGEVTDSSPVIVYLDSEVVNRTTQKRLLRFSDAMK
jgi:hypothetical protein